MHARWVEVRERQAEEKEVAGQKSPTPSPTSESAAPAAPPAPDARTVAQAVQAVTEGDRHFRVGDFETALRLFQQAEALLPADPAIQFRLGQAYEELQDKVAAYAAYERSLAVPGLPADLRRSAEQKLALLAQTIPPSTRSTATPSRLHSAVADPGTAVRDETGLQPGATLGLVSASLRDGQPGTKNLRVAIKARPGVRVDVSKMNVFVYFYEKGPDDEIVLTDSKPSTQWISPPVDWADAEPEILDVEYILPDSGLPGSSEDFGGKGRKFFGYVVAVYYNGELQDTRAEPGRLSTIADLPLYLDQEVAP